MNILDVAILLFVILESLNILILYFFPDSKRGNGISVFSHWEKSKEKEEVHLFAKYMANWVAGSKLIFIGLLVVILLTGSDTTKFYAIISMIISIGTYFWKLHPIISRLDDLGGISPKGYSITLGKMISTFLLVFSVVAIVYYVFNMI